MGKGGGKGEREGRKGMAGPIPNPQLWVCVYTVQFSLWVYSAGVDCIVTVLFQILVISAVVVVVWQCCHVSFSAYVSPRCCFPSAFPSGQFLPFPVTLLLHLYVYNPSQHSLSSLYYHSVQLPHSFCRTLLLLLCREYATFESVGFCVNLQC